MTSSVAAPDSALEARLGQIADEFTQRLQRGEHPDIEDYARRHPEMADVVRQVLAALQVMGSSERDPVSLDEGLAAAPANGCLGDFRIVREIGRGGMGIVYAAEQISLSRRVALKVLAFAATLDPKQLQRFKNEAQAAAQLHHQNIVPVFAVGCERGVHYYAMQFVEGQTLAQVIADLKKEAGPDSMPSPLQPEAAPTGPYTPEPVQQSAICNLQSAIAVTTPKVGVPKESSVSNPAFFRTVAKLGVQAAEALEHAHELGVIHRDIKPANLLVETSSPLAPPPAGIESEGLRLWITDFGLAQMASPGGDAGGSLTLTGDLVGTVRYMSPEQTLAKRGMLDHRTDIYSLGVTLYELLTLEPAFIGRDRNEVLHKIALEEPRPPRRVNKAIPAELETIILKTLEKNPAERYATAQELADDLERYLKDEPIRATRPTFVQRARKWGRRHQAVVWSAGVSAMVLLLLVLVGLTAGILVVDAERKETDRAYGKLSEEQTHTQEALGKAKAAEEAEARRRRQARTALDAMTSLMVGDMLAKQDPPTEVQKQFLAQALQIYEQFASDTGPDEESRYGVAQAYLRVARIRARLALTHEALAACRESISAFSQLAADSPALPQYVQGLAASHNVHGIVLQTLGMRPQAEQAFQQALPIQEKLAAEFPAVEQYRQDLANLYSNLGILSKGMGKWRLAEQFYRQALPIQEKLATESPAVRQYRQDVAISLSNLGNLLTLTGQWREAEKAFCKALVIQEKLAADFPTVRHYRQDAAASYSNLGSLLVDHLGRTKQGQEAFQQAITFLAKLAADFPGLPEYRQELAKSYANLGIALKLLGRQPHAEDAIRQALAIFTKLGADFPKVPEYRDDLARVHCVLGDLLHAMSKWPQAEAAFQQALTIQERLATDFPADSQYREHLANSHNNLGVLLYTSGKFTAAEQAYRKALELREKLATDFVAVPGYRIELGGSQCNFGILLRAQKQPRKALEWFARAIATLEEVLRQTPVEIKARLYMRNAYSGRAQAHDDLKQYTEAIAAWDQAVELSPAQERGEFRMSRAASRARAGHLAPAMQEAEDLAKNGDAVMLYNAACLFALAGASSSAAPGLAEAREKCAKRAIDLLRQAVAKGWQDIEHLKTDEDLSVLRERADFQGLVNDLEKRRPRKQ
jgi:serine/threonine protein kinase/Tfp pilus assembly protein PilF